MSSSSSSSLTTAASGSDLSFLAALERLSATQTATLDARDNLLKENNQGLQQAKTACKTHCESLRRTLLDSASSCFDKTNIPVALAMSLLGPRDVATASCVSQQWNRTAKTALVQESIWVLHAFHHDLEFYLANSHNHALLVSRMKEKTTHAVITTKVAVLTAQNRIL